MKLSIRPTDPEIEPADTGYYIIRGTKCGRDKNGPVHCRASATFTGAIPSLRTRPDIPAICAGINRDGN